MAMYDYKHGIEIESAGVSLHEHINVYSGN